MEEILYPKFPPQNSFYALGDRGPKFLPKPFFFPLNIVDFHWPTPSISPHLDEPPNGLKFLTKGNQIVKLWFTTMFYVGFIPWQKVL